ncbi:MAG: hypothetical protein ACD_75C00496G0002 [uncultured bacterium]|nr:MAG: hypothetical protein ACD_75C00496G0002 [uncultured bacterium]
MYFVTVAGKNLMRRKMRTLFTLLGIGSAVAAFVALVGLARGFENAWMLALLERDTHVFAVPRGVVDILSASIDEEVGARMAGVAGVTAVSGELVDMVDLDSGEMIVVAGWPLDSYLWESVALESGRVPGKDLPNGVVLGKNAAETLGYKVGDIFQVRTMTFILAGVCKAGGVMRNHAMLLSLSALQELNNRQGQVSTLNFRLADFRDRDRVADTMARLRSLFPDYVFTEAIDLAENNKILALFRAMAWGTSTIALFIGLVVIINTLLMSVMERTRELGLLASVGWSGKRILSLIVIEGLALSVLGGFTGVIIGLSGLYAIAGSPHMQGLIHPSVDLGLLVEVTIATLLLGLIGSVYPAWRAIRLRPADALRYE